MTKNIVPHRTHKHHEHYTLFKTDKRAKNTIVWNHVVTGKLPASREVTNPLTAAD